MTHSNFGCGVLFVYPLEWVDEEITNIEGLTPACGASDWVGRELGGYTWICGTSSLY